MNKILVFGASGQLGNCLKTVAERRGNTDLVFPEEGSANILDAEMLEKLLDEVRPAYVINCAAYTAVDKAEDEIDLARAVNRDGAKNLAQVCEQYEAVLVHVSTDFVFEGKIPQMLTEADVANPINVYGLTKLEGEQIIPEHLDEYFILRTSWLYSEYGNNFVKTMLKLGADRDELKIIADQVGTPTYGIDLADAILTIIESKSTAYGLYHYSNEGLTSWYDFAKSIFDISGTTVKAYPVPTSEYVTKAVRPAFSVMDKSKIKKTFGIEIPYWRDSLVACIQQINIQELLKL
jgi:dTDP-4-dehydrorhamnose reductase